MSLPAQLYRSMRLQESLTVELFICEPFIIKYAPLDLVLKFLWQLNEDSGDYAALDIWGLGLLILIRDMEESNKG